MIAIIDYKAGNLGSVQNALNRLGVKSVVTNDASQIKAAQAVIFPGQGRAGVAMAELRRTGLDQLIPQLRQPFLGICLGMQLLAEASEEDEVECLSVIPVRCRRFPPSLKLPQIGWNKVNFAKPNRLTKGIPDGEYFYFVNSYYFDASEPYVVGTTSYGFEFPSIVNKDNFFAVQFHPEKSGTAGEQLLKNFCEVAKCL
jgi:imidazole glycerol-phosphate synthase subunit HisH